MRKLFAERAALDKNSKVSPTPCFQWVIIISDLSALLRVGSAEAGGEADKKEPSERLSKQRSVCGEGKGKALGEVNHPATFHRDQEVSSGIAFACTTVLAEKSFRGELPRTSASFPGSALYWQVSVWSSKSQTFLVVGSGYFCVPVLTALLHPQPLPLPLEPLPTGLHEARRLSHDSPLPMSLWGVP